MFCVRLFRCFVLTFCRFLTDIIDLNQDKAIEAFKEMVLNRKNPAMGEYEVLESLRKIGLNDTANYLHALCK